MRYRFKQAKILWNRLAKKEYKIKNYERFKANLRCKAEQTGQRSIEICSYQAYDWASHIIDF